MFEKSVCVVYLFTSDSQHQATYYRHSAIVPILLAQGADIETMDYVSSLGFCLL